MCQKHEHAHHAEPAAAPAGSVHGHVILNWLADAPLTINEMQDRCTSEFGAAPQFHTCDTTGLSLTALLGLLAERGKIVKAGSGWRSDMTQVCADA